MLRVGCLLEAKRPLHGARTLYRGLTTDRNIGVRSMSDGSVIEQLTAVNSKVCSVCGVNKHLSAYEIRKSNNTYRKQCRDCRYKQHNAWYKENADAQSLAKQRASARYKADKPGVKAYVNEWRRQNRDKVHQYSKNAYDNSRLDFDKYIAYAIKSKKAQCVSQEIEFNITPSDIKQLFKSQEGLCALTDRELLWGQKGWHRDTLSIDRIVSDLGYIKSNIRLVTLQVNRARGNLSDAQLFKLCHRVLFKANCSYVKCDFEDGDASVPLIQDSITENSEAMEDYSLTLPEDLL